MRWTKATGAALVLTAMTSFAERPPPRGHAEVTASADGGTGGTDGARFLATLPAATREELKKDGVALLDLKPKGPIRAVLRFERSREQVFAIITQPSTMASYLPHVTQSKTVGVRTDEGESIDTVVSFVFVFSYRSQHWFYPEEHRMEWNLDPAGGNGLTAQEGFFQLYALDEKTTLAEYGTRVVAKDGFLEFLRSLGERGGIAEALGAIRKHVEMAP